MISEHISYGRGKSSLGPAITLSTYGLCDRVNFTLAIGPTALFVQSVGELSQTRRNDGTVAHGKAQSASILCSICKDCSSRVRWSGGAF
jgi:hypothetical protein